MICRQMRRGTLHTALIKDILCSSMLAPTPTFLSCSNTHCAAVWPIGPAACACSRSAMAKTLVDMPLNSLNYLAAMHWQTTVRHCQGMKLHTESSRDQPKKGKEDASECCLCCYTTLRNMHETRPKPVATCTAYLLHVSAQHSNLTPYNC